MTKEELMELLRDPNQTGQAVDELDRLVEKNPYFHTGHQLYIKGLQQTDENKMALQLNKTALNVRDRGVLYNYLNKPSTIQQQTLSKDQPNETLTPFVPGNSFVSPEADIHDVHTVQNEPFESSHQQVIHLKGRQGEERIIVAEEKILSDTQLMDVIRLRLDQIEPTDSTSSEIVPENTEFSDQEQNVEIRDVYSEDQLVADLMKITPIRTDLTETPPQDIVAEETTENVEEIVEKKEQTSLELINSFLQTNPKIIPRDSNTYQVDLSESLQEIPSIATETLADIYASQGHKDKAIEIYEQLILNFPEKHIYFAAQINRLKL